MRSFVDLLRVDKGFNPERVLTVELGLPGSRYPDHEKRSRFDHALVESVASMPDIAAAGIANQLPLGGEGNNNLISPEGTNLPLIERPLADIRQVNPEYFRAMGIPLRSGGSSTSTTGGGPWRWFPRLPPPASGREPTRWGSGSSPAAAAWG